jgi:predicted metal-dependent RNase
LQDGAKEIKMLGEIVPVRARVTVLDGFSAHADQEEILRWLRTFKKPPRMTYVVHGEPAAASTFAWIDPRTAQLESRSGEVPAEDLASIVCVMKGLRIILLPNA